MNSDLYNIIHIRLNHAFAIYSYICIHCYRHFPMHGIHYHVFYYTVSLYEIYNNIIKTLFKNTPYMSVLLFKTFRRLPAPNPVAHTQTPPFHGRGVSLEVPGVTSSGAWHRRPTPREPCPPRPCLFHDTLLCSRLLNIGNYSSPDMWENEGKRSRFKESKNQRYPASDTSSALLRPSAITTSEVVAYLPSARDLRDPREQYSRVHRCLDGRALSPLL